jgi:predicted permease
MVPSLLLIMLPLFTLVAGGYFLSRLLTLSEETLVRIITDFFMPILVFYSLYSSDIELAAAGKVAGAAAAVLLALLAVSALYAHLVRADARSFIPPVIFTNSGFLGIPLMKLWGGLPAMNLIVIYDQIQTVFIFTLGILVVSGGITARGLRQMVRSPMLWAIAAGFTVHFLRLPLPAAAATTLEFAGIGTPALAAFALGCSLSRTQIVLSVHLVAGFLFRVALGFLFGVGAALLLRIEGTAATVVIVASALPAAVFSFVLPARYGVRPNLAAPLVLLTTVAGIFTIPLAFYGAALLLP